MDAIVRDLFAESVNDDRFSTRGMLSDATVDACLQSLRLSNMNTRSGRLISIRCGPETVF